MPTSTVMRINASHVEKHKAVSMLVAFCLGCVACLFLGDERSSQRSGTKSKAQKPESESAATFPKANLDSSQPVQALHHGSAQSHSLGPRKWPAPDTYPSRLVSQPAWLVGNRDSLVTLGIRLQI